MTKGRLEAFSDGVLAIILTIMVLELRAPARSEPEALLPLLPALAAYVLSFLYIGIYWSNHHHLLHAVSHVDGATLWANLHLLFWLSLVPFVTKWTGDTGLTPWPVAAYGLVLLLAGFAYWILVRVLIRRHGPESPLARAVGRDMKGGLSLLIYATAVGVAFVEPWLSCLLYLAVAAMWLVPDRRIERTLNGPPPEPRMAEPRAVA